MHQEYDWDIAVVMDKGLPTNMPEILFEGGVPMGVVTAYERVFQEYTPGTLMLNLRERRN